MSNRTSWDARGGTNCRIAPSFDTSPRKRRSEYGWAVFGLVFFSGPLGAQSLVFETTHVDVGRVSSAGVLERPFRFRAVGGPADIDEVRPSCGCLRPRLAKTHYEPGERGEIVLAVHAASQRSGPKRFQLTVRLRDPEPRTLALVLDVDLVSELVIEPSNLLLYLAGNDAVEQSIRIVDRRPRPLTVSAIATSSPRLRAELAPLALAGGSAAPAITIELTVAGDYPVGQFEESVEVRTDDPQYPVLLIPVTIVRRGRLTLLPERIAVPARSLGSGPILRQFILRDQEGQPIRIAGVAANVPGIECIWPATAERFPRLRVQLDPAHVKGPLEAQLRIQVAEPVPTLLTGSLVVE